MNEEEFIKQLAALLDSKTAQQLYNDGLSPPVREAGGLASDVMKTARLFAAPFQVAAAYQDRFKRYLDRVIREVPEDRRIPAASQIAGPVFEELRYCEDGSPITELYLNLLARAIDKERVDEAHPAFVKIIGFLSPDEVLILHHLAQRSYEEVYESDLDLEANRFVNKRITSREFPIDELVFPKNFYVYTSHLSSLDLVDFRVYKQLPLKTDEQNPVQTGERGYARLFLTDFGSMFVKACNPPSSTSRDPSV